MSYVKENLDDKFKYLSNLNNLIILHTDIKRDKLYQGFMNTSRIENFVDILLASIYFNRNEVDDNNNNIDIDIDSDDDLIYYN